VNDGAKGSHHGHRVFMLPDIPPQVQARCPLLHSIADKFEDLAFRLTPGPACHDYRHGAAFDNPVEIFAPVGLNHLGTQFGGDPAAEPEIPCVSLFQLFPNSRDGHHGNAVVFTLVHQFSQIQKGVVLVVASHKDRHTDGGHIEADSLLDRRGYSLVGEVISDDARTAGDSQNDRWTVLWINTGT
jgi:hypothetical protein